MPWDNHRPANAKYQTREHRRQRKLLEQQMQRLGYLTCAQPECVMPTRHITKGEEWHTGHDDTGTRYIGAVHPRCNLRDAALRANDRGRGGRGGSAGGWDL